MTQMMNFLLARTRRERWLLGILFFAGLPLGWYQGVIVPLETRAAEARQALDDSRALQQWLEARRVELDALPEPNARAPRSLPGLSAIEGSLRQAGLDDSITTLATATGGGVALQMEDVEFTEVMPWLDQFERETGYRMAQLTLRRAEIAGHVAAEILLQPEP